jgi:hypothetical protein
MQVRIFNGGVVVLFYIMLLTSSVIFDFIPVLLHLLVLKRISLLILLVFYLNLGFHASDCERTAFWDMTLRGLLNLSGMSQE